MSPKIFYKNEEEIITATGPIEKVIDWLEEQLYIFHELTPTKSDWRLDLLHNEPVIFDYHSCNFCVVWYDKEKGAFFVKDIDLPIFC